MKISIEAETTLCIAVEIDGRKGHIEAAGGTWYWNEGQQRANIGSVSRLSWLGALNKAIKILTDDWHV